MKRPRLSNPPRLSSCVIERLRIECNCLTCGRFGYWRPIEMIDNLGDIPVIDVHKHIRCKECGSTWCQARPDYAMSYKNGRMGFTLDGEW